MPVHGGCVATPAIVNANVLDVDCGQIPGLYAAGNVMASPMGMTHGGAARAPVIGS